MEESKIKEGVVLIAIDECLLRRSNQKVLVFDKEYVVKNVQLQEGTFCVNGEHGNHFFKIKSYKDFFVIKSTTVETKDKMYKYVVETIVRNVAQYSTKKAIDQLKEEFIIIRKPKS